jgi:hypothetical protein
MTPGLASNDHNDFLWAKHADGSLGGSLSANYPTKRARKQLARAGWLELAVASSWFVRCL